MLDSALLLALYALTEAFFLLGQRLGFLMSKDLWDTSPALESLLLFVLCFVFFNMMCDSELWNKILAASMQQVQGILKTHIHVGRRVGEKVVFIMRKLPFFKLKFQVLTV